MKSSGKTEPFGGSSRVGGRRLPDLGGPVRAGPAPGYLGDQRRLVGRGQAQHGADHRGRRAELRLQRPQPDRDV